MSANKTVLLCRHFLACLLVLIGTAWEPRSAFAEAGVAKANGQTSRLDRSGKARKGNASYYGREFYRKKMASGKPMNPHGHAAASKSLPIGTKAKVTNLETGKSDIVDIEDRGPYIKGRIIDVTPATADKLDMKKDGTAPVRVQPIELPPKDGSEKPDAAHVP